MSTQAQDNQNRRVVPMRLRSVSVVDSVARFFNSLWSMALQHLHTLSPQIVSLVVCLLAIPILILFSSVAGWLVWKNVPKGWAVPVYLQYGDGGSPYAYLSVDSLFSNQPYDLSLHLSVPATEANYGLGNFMTTLTVTDPYNNKTLASIRKPGLVLPPSPSLIPFVSRTPRLIDIVLPLASKLITGRDKIFAHLELGRHDGWRNIGSGGGRELSVHEAFLRGDVHPQGLRRLLSAFPLSVAIAAAVTFFIVSTVILIGFFIPSIQWRVEPPAQEDEKPPSPPQGEVMSLKTSSDDEHDFLSTKEEPYEQHIPVAGPSTSPEPELRLRSRKRLSS